MHNKKFNTQKEFEEFLRSKPIVITSDVYYDSAESLKYGDLEDELAYFEQAGFVRGEDVWLPKGLKLEFTHSANPGGAGYYYFKTLGLDVDFEFAWNSTFIEDLLENTDVFAEDLTLGEDIDADFEDEDEAGEEELQRLRYLLNKEEVCPLDKGERLEILQLMDKYGDIIELENQYKESDIKYCVYTLDPEWDYDEDELIGCFDSEDEAISFAKNQNCPTHVVQVIDDGDESEVIYSSIEESLNEEKEEKWNIGSNKLVSVGSKEFMNLMKLADMLEKNSPNGYSYKVGKTWEDYGAGMEWYTIICTDTEGRTHQVLNSKQWIDLANSGDIEAVYQDVIKGKYFNDKALDESFGYESEKEELIVQLCKANNLKAENLGKYGTDEYWLADAIENLQDLDYIYQTYVPDSLKDKFKAVTGYEEEDEDLDESFNGDEVATFSDWIQDYRDGALWDEFAAEFSDEAEELDIDSILSWLEEFDEDAYYDYIDYIEDDLDESLKNELKDRAKKHKKTDKKGAKGWFVNLNAGNVEYNNAFFNHVMGRSGEVSATEAVESSPLMSRNVREDVSEVLNEWCKDGAHGAYKPEDADELSLSGCFHEPYVTLRHMSGGFGFNIDFGTADKDRALKDLNYTLSEFGIYAKTTRPESNDGNDVVMLQPIKTNPLQERLDRETIPLYYPSLEVTRVLRAGDPSGAYDQYQNQWYPDEDETEEIEIEYEYEVDKIDIFNELVELIDESDIEDIEKKEDDEIINFVEEHFDELLEKYQEKILEYFREAAREDAEMNYEHDNLNEAMGPRRKTYVEYSGAGLNKIKGALISCQMQEHETIAWELDIDIDDFEDTDEYWKLIENEVVEIVENIMESKEAVYIDGGIQMVDAPGWGAYPGALGRAVVKLKDGRIFSFDDTDAPYSLFNIVELTGMCEEEDPKTFNIDKYFDYFGEEEDLDESADLKDVKPFSKKQIRDELKLDTNNFTIEQGSYAYGFESECLAAVDVLKKYYKFVEYHTEDGHAGDVVYVVEFGKEDRELNESSTVLSSIDPEVFEKLDNLSNMCDNYTTSQLGLKPNKQTKCYNMHIRSRNARNHREKVSEILEAAKKILDENKISYKVKYLQTDDEKGVSFAAIEISPKMSIDVEDSRVCDKCGRPLTTVGECPLCDLGDRSVLDEEFWLSEGIETHDQLNPELWNEDEELKPEVKEKIEEIVNLFKDQLAEDDVMLDIKDIIIVGSNASYNYGEHSDLDVHIIADTSKINCPLKLLPTLYNAYKSLFNDKYDITINGVEVELYVEENEAAVRSNGIYSLNSGWVKKPVREDIPEVDFQDLLMKYINEYYEVIASDSLERVEKFIDKIYELRKVSIANSGEYSKGNLVFKELRNMDFLQYLKDKRDLLTSRKLSLEKE